MATSPQRRPPAGSLHCPNCGAIADDQATQCPYCQARLATISCPSCFRRLFLGAAFCSHCGARAAREDDSAAADCRCPRCRRARMKAVSLGSLSLLECDKCAGVWVAADVFDRLCADREAQAAVVHGGTGGRERVTTPDADIRYRPCPRCKKMMNRVNFAARSGVILDVCREHGTFFDRDELHRVVTFIQSGGIERARAKELESLKEEQRRLRALQAAPAPLNLRQQTSYESGGGLFDLFIDTLLDR